MQQSNDDLNKCQQSKATCEKGRVVEGGNLKQCQDNHRNCQSRVNDLTKIVENGKKVKVAHDQCKAKLKKLEQDRLKNTGKHNCLDIIRSSCFFLLNAFPVICEGLSFRP